MMYDDRKLRGSECESLQASNKTKKKLFLHTNEALKRFSQFVSSWPLELSVKLSRLKKKSYSFCFGLDKVKVTVLVE